MAKIRLITGKQNRRAKRSLAGVRRPAGATRGASALRSAARVKKFR